MAIDMGLFLLVILTVWLIRVTYFAMLASCVIDIILGFTDKFDWVDWTSLFIRLAAVAIIIFFCESLLDDTIVGNDCPMDGDEGSALASAGFGTDEDYGGFGDFDF